MAEGRGFEPPRDSRPYPISSRTPSTGLGHPSAPMLSMTYRVCSLFASNGHRRRVQVKSKFQSARSTYRGNRHDLLDGCGQVALKHMSVALNHAQVPPPAEFLNRSQVYPSSHQTGSEGMAERGRGDAVQAKRLALLAGATAKRRGEVRRSASTRASRSRATMIRW
jgi:hypothetical protein